MDTLSADMEESVIILTDCASLLQNNEIQNNVLKKVIQNIQMLSGANESEKYIDQLKDEDFWYIYRETFGENSKDLCTLDMAIVLSCIKKLLKKWKNYHAEGSGEHVLNDVAEKITVFLQDNVNYVLSLRDSVLDKCETDLNKTAVEAHCSCEKLKTLFYREVPPDNDIVNSDLSKKFTQSAEKQASIVSRYLINWPNVSVDIQLPGFSFRHSFIKHSQYKLIRFRKGYKPRATGGSRSTGLRVGATEEGNKTVPIDQILNYIDQMKHILRQNNSMRITRKMELLNILSEMRLDAESCNDTVTTKTEYYIPTSKYPFVRYLGQPAKEGAETPLIEMAEQIQTSENLTDVRLQETAQSFIMFKVAEFNPIEGGEISAEFQRNVEDVMTKSNTCLVFTCSCKKTFNSLSSSEEIGKHLIHEHGVEPDWICPQCRYIISTRELSSERWFHKCRKKKGGKNKLRSRNK